MDKSFNEMNGLELLNAIEEKLIISRKKRFIDISKMGCPIDTEKLMFLTKLTKKNQILGTQILMVKNIKANNVSAYLIFKSKFQEQYEEYIANTTTSKERVDESKFAIDWLKVMEIWEIYKYS